MPPGWGLDGDRALANGFAFCFPLPKVGLAVGADLLLLRAGELDAGFAGAQEPVGEHRHDGECHEQ